MFSSLKDQRVAYFGLWSDEQRSESMAAEALRILSSAVARCEDDDIWSKELDDVLNWVERRAARTYPVQCFRDAMHIQHPAERKLALRDAYVRIMRELGLFSGRL